MVLIKQKRFVYTCMLIGAICFQLFAPIHVFAGSHDHSLASEMNDSDMADMSTCMSVCMRAIEEKNVQPIFLSNDFFAIIKTDDRLAKIKNDNFHHHVQKRTRPDVRLCLIQEFRE